MTVLLAPRYWWAHLLALAAVTVATLLGLWQYDAYTAQREAEARDLTRAEPVPLAGVMGPDDPFPGDRVGQPVRVAGTWVPDGTVLVTNREHEDRDGYWVATPLAVGGPDEPVLYVVRGWTDAPDAAPAPPRGEAELVGWLQPTEGTGEMDTDRDDDVLPQLRTADLVQHVEQDLYGAYAVLSEVTAAGADAAGDPAGTEGLEPATLEQLPRVGGATGLRNLFYAVEWWVFGLFAAYIWWRYVRDVTSERAAAQVGAPAAEDDPLPSRT